jgi:acetyl-CoA carboxylase carboxyl transferase subunit alpha
MNNKRQLARERLRRIRKRAREREKKEKQQQRRQKSNLEERAQRPEPLAQAEQMSQPMTPTNDNRKETEDKQRDIDALEREVAELGRLSPANHLASSEIERIRREVEELKHEFYTHLGAWQRVQLARHPQRPYAEDFIRLIFDHFSEIHGDRGFSDDPAMLTGMAQFHGKPVMIIANRKGRDLKQRMARNFGQSKPDGYRKALRVMRIAEKFGRPIVVFIDTPGAYPGIDAEERGQAEAIAHNLREMARMPVPIVIVITGEGGSGGALATAIGDRVFMLENSIYSVISPEGCASIMWRDASKAEIAAQALKLTAQDLLELKLIDEIIPEPEGGAHYDHDATAQLIDPYISRSLDELSSLPAKELVDQRYQKFRRMGQFFA